MSEFDLHVATEPYTDKEFAARLSELGLIDDGLVDRHVTFYANMAISACPLIGMHLTKKYHTLSPGEAKAIIDSDISRIHGLFRDHRVVGYAHAEVTSTANDITLKSNHGFNDHVPWPVAQFKPSFSETNKQWDIHIAFPLDYLPGKLADILECSGMYSIDLLKHRDGHSRRFRIYTIQGITATAQGKTLFNSLVEWFRATSTPHVEIKLEHYLAMIRAGKPTIVPPTIDHVEYLSVCESAQSTRPVQFV